MRWGGGGETWGWRKNRDIADLDRHDFMDGWIRGAKKVEFEDMKSS